MSVNSLILFVFVIMRVCALEDQSILLQIASGTSDCNKDKMLKDFDLSKVVQFKAMCNIPRPLDSEADYLLENNVVPILCMCLQGKFTEICKSAVEDMNSFTDILPPTEKKFSNIFSNLSKNENFNDISKFCTNTTKNYIVETPASNITQLWWEIFNKQLNDTKSCTWLCGTHGNKVKPLCSYIVWSNAIYLNFKRSRPKVGSSITTMVEEPRNQIESENSNNMVEKQLEGLAPAENHPSFGEHDVSGAQAATLLPQKPAISSILVGDHNVTSGSVGGASGNIEDMNSRQNIVDEHLSEEQVKVIPNISLDNTSHNKTEPSLNPSNTEVKPLEETDKGKKKYSKNKSMDGKPQPVDSKKPANPIIKGDLSHKVAAEGVGLNQSNDNFQDQQQQPSSGKEQINQISQIKLNNLDKIVGKQSEGLSQTENHTSFGQYDVSGGQAVTPTPQKPTESSLIFVDPNVTLGPSGVNTGQSEQPNTEKTDGLDLPYPDPKGQQQPPYSDEAEDEDGDDIDMDLDPSDAFNTKIDSKYLEKPGQPQVVPEEGEVDLIPDKFIETEDSNFIFYFLWMTVLTVLVYVAFQNKKKLLALAMEGRKSRSSRRRPNSSFYSKLDSNLEEAMLSNPKKASVTQVFY